MFLQALAQSVDGSSLQWAKPEDQQQLFLQLITQSCLYMASLRCGVDTQRLDLSAFDSVGQFDTKALAFCLGSACQRASKPLMHTVRLDNCLHNLYSSREDILIAVENASLRPAQLRALLESQTRFVTCR